MVDLLYGKFGGLDRKFAIYAESDASASNIIACHFTKHQQEIPVDGLQVLSVQFNSPFLYSVDNASHGSTIQHAWMISDKPTSGILLAQASWR